MVEYNFTTPITEIDVSQLRIGDFVHISGYIFTARDEVHRRAIKWAEGKKNLPISIEGLPMYHCGPMRLHEN